jgi:hypothetical protein
MKNWSVIADGYGLGIPASDLDRVVRPLDALEADFHPIRASFSSDADSAIIFEAALEAE